MRKSIKLDKHVPLEEMIEMAQMHEEKHKYLEKQIRYQKTLEKKPMLYYIKNTVIVVLILGYLFIMYGPYNYMEKLLSLVQPKDEDSQTLNSALESGGLMILCYILRFTDERIIQFLKDTVCQCICRMNFDDTKGFLLGDGISTSDVEVGNDKDNDDEHGSGEILLTTDLATGMLTVSDVYTRTTTWDEACEKLLHTKCQAYTIALFRLVCIHWFQPIFYWLIFIAS